MNAFNPDFSHRLNALSHNCEDFTAADLTDTILLMCQRAAAIIDVVALQFEGEVGRMNDVINSAALMAAVNEIHDIEAITTAFHEKKERKAAV